MAKILVTTWKDVLKHWSLWANNVNGLISTVYLACAVFLQAKLPVTWFAAIVLTMSIVTGVCKFISQDKVISLVSDILTGLGIKAPPIPEGDDPQAPKAFGVSSLPLKETTASPPV